MGDPETQVILPRIKMIYGYNDILCKSELDKVNLEFDPQYYTNVVLASKGYPEDL